MDPLQILALAALLSPGACMPDDLDQALEGLASPASLERRAAEQWLARHLELEHQGRLIEALEGSDAELRQRLAGALGSFDRHLGLAASLSLESDPAAVEVGEQALRALVLRWNPALRQPALRGPELVEALDGLHTGSEEGSLLVEVEPDLGSLLDRLARVVELPLGLVLDPALSTAGVPPHPAGEGPPLYGTWQDVLLGLSPSYRVELWLAGAGAGLGTLGPEPFALLAHSQDERAAQPVALLSSWVLTFAGGQTAHERGAAARALAACGWPAALAWMEALAGERDSASAWEGLLLAAGRGRGSRLLREPEIIRRLLRRADQGRPSASGQGREEDLRQAFEIQHALAGLGPVNHAGQPLTPVLLEGWEGLGARERWWRMCVFESWGRGASGALAVVSELLLSPPGSHEPRLLLQALRAAAAVTAQPGGPLAGARAGDPAGLLAAPRSAAELRELPGLLGRVGLLPPQSWRAPTALPSQELGQALVVLEWWLHLGEVQLAAEHLSATGAASGPWPRYESPSVASLPPPEPWWRQAFVAEVLSAWVQRGEAQRCADLFALLRSSTPGDPAVPGCLDRLELLVGRLSDERQEELLEWLLSAPGLPSDPVALGHLVGGPADLGARAALEGLLRGSGAETDAALLLEGLRIGLEQLRARSMDEEARRWVGQLRRASVVGGAHPLAVHLLGPWERPPHLRTRALAERDRGPEPSLPMGR